MIEMASHIFMGRLILRYLNHLCSTEHSDPYKLDATPKGEDKGKGISKNNVTQGRVKDIALRVDRGRQTLNIVDDQLYEQYNGNFERQNVQNKMAKIICTNTVVNPGAVVIMLRHAAPTAPTVFAS